MFYIVSSEPGNSVDYLTLKGYKILGKADVVFYHSLFDTTALFEACKPSCEKISVRVLPVERRVCYVENNPDKLCVELISGDMAWFSTAQELMDKLAERGIPFEVVPGVSSINMAAALLKHELVLPCISQCCIVTYLENMPMIPKQSIEKLASHEATLVVLMVNERRLSEFRRQLLAGGVSKDTPVAVVYKASYPGQKVFRMTVDGLEGLKGDLWHAIFVVGWVLADEEKRHGLSGLPFMTNFAKAEAYVYGLPWIS